MIQIQMLEYIDRSVSLPNVLFRVAGVAKPNNQTLHPKLTPLTYLHHGIAAFLCA